MNNKVMLLSIGWAAMAVASCGPEYHAKKVREADTEKRLTLGNVQREIREGMSGGEVAEVLGSPNIVSTDETGNEVWIYDKFATDVVHSESGWSIIGAVVGFGSDAVGGVGGGARSGAGAASRSQRTLTVVIKFDEQKRVRTVAYHTSRF